MTSFPQKLRFVIIDLIDKYESNTSPRIKYTIEITRIYIIHEEAKSKKFLRILTISLENTENKRWEETHLLD